MRIVASCPVASCCRTASFNGLGRCPKCNVLLIAKPSPRRKAMDLRGKGPAFRWHPDRDGPASIIVRYAELDEAGRERTVVLEERGFWAPVSGIVRLQPDFRRVAVHHFAWERRVRYIEHPEACHA